MFCGVNLYTNTKGSIKDAVNIINDNTIYTIYSIYSAVSIKQNTVKTIIHMNFIPMLR